MRHLFRSLSIFSLLSFTLLSCGEGEEKGDPADTLVVADTLPEPVLEVLASGDIMLVPVKDSPEFSDATLALVSPDSGAMVKPGMVPFKFNVENYELGAQTDDAGMKLCANSGKGQHIHFILDNQPYAAYYTAEFKHELPAGEHILLAFLSRSYHESLKHEGAAVVTKLTAGGGEPAGQADLTEPLMFYSRPKGEYYGNDTTKVLLDFYLINTELSPTGYTVKATINGEELRLTEWKPYFIQGLPLGESTIKLELVDAMGEPVPGAYNIVERTITLGAEAPKS